MAEKKTILVRCPSSGKIHILIKDDFKGKKDASFTCPDCGKEHSVPD
jgi:transposase-like protein